MWRNCYPKHPLVRALWYGEHQDVRCLPDDTFPVLTQLLDDITREATIAIRMESTMSDNGYKGRKVDTAPAKMQKLLKRFDGDSKVGVPTKKLSANGGRILLFVNSPEFRLQIAQASAGGKELTLEESEAIWKDMGMSYNGKFCLPLTQSGVQVAGIFSTGKSVPVAGESEDLFTF